MNNQVFGVELFLNTLKNNNLSMLNLSDINVVEFLLKNRYELNNYIEEYKSVNENLETKNEISEEIVAIIYSLDDILENINMTNRQKKILSLLKFGFTFSDIGNASEIKVSRKNAIKSFNSLCNRVVKENRKRWKESNIKE